MHHQDKEARKGDKRCRRDERDFRLGQIRADLPVRRRRNRRGGGHLGRRQAGGPGGARRGGRAPRGRARHAARTLAAQEPVGRGLVGLLAGAGCNLGTVRMPTE